MTGAVYYDFISKALPLLLQIVDLQTRLYLSFMHDAAQHIFLLAVREFLNNVFPEQWIGRDGPTEGPVPSTDLCLLHLHLWGHLKSTVCATEVSDVQDFQQ
jgi:hypothetical protein